MTKEITDPEILLESCNKIKDFYVNTFWNTPRTEAYVRHASCVVSYK